MEWIMILADGICVWMFDINIGFVRIKGAKGQSQN